MDGNGRWANRRLLPRVAGHKRGVDGLRRCVRACAERGVGVLTVFAFSSENWRRPAEEVSALMELLATALTREVPQLSADGVRLYFIGDRTGLSDSVAKGLTHAEGSDCTQHPARAEHLLQLRRALGYRASRSKTGCVRRADHGNQSGCGLGVGACGGSRSADSHGRGTAHSATFCSGRRLIPSFISVTRCGRISTRRRWTLRFSTFNGRERRFGKTSAQLAPAVARPVAA